MSRGYAPSPVHRPRCLTRLHLYLDCPPLSPVDNQDFRLQQYSEAFRLFGPEVASRAWGAKGKNSPFYYICSGTTMRYPTCDFCEAFYPLALYPEPTTKRECKGLVTDRHFYSHLPLPERTAVADLAKYVEKPKKGKAKPSDKDQYGTFSKGNSEALGRVFGRAEPCKVKCLAERAACAKLSTRSGVSPAVRAKLNHADPPVLWSYGETGAWARLVLEYGLGFVSGSVLVETTDEVVLRHEGASATTPEAACADARAHSSGPIMVAVTALDGGGDEMAPQRFLSRLAPACFGLRPFEAAVVVTRNP